MWNVIEIQPVFNFKMFLRFILSLFVAVLHSAGPTNSSISLEPLYPAKKLRLGHNYNGFKPTLVGSHENEIMFDAQDSNTVLINKRRVLLCDC